MNGDQPYAVRIQKQVEKEILSLPKTIIERVRTAIRDLANTPRPHGCAKVKGSKNLYRIRVGDYRVIYAMDDEIRVLDVTKVGHRREVYD